MYQELKYGQITFKTRSYTSNISEVNETFLNCRQVRTHNKLDNYNNHRTTYGGTEIQSQYAWTNQKLQHQTSPINQQFTNFCMLVRTNQNNKSVVALKSIFTETF